MAEINWKNIDTIPEDWLDGRRVLVFDAVKMIPLVMEYWKGGWQLNEQHQMFSLVTHYAADVSVCPNDLPVERKEDYLALDNSATRKWAIALTYARQHTPIHGINGLKPRPSVLWIAIQKMVTPERTITVYRKRVAEAWELVYRQEHSHLKVAADLRALTEAGLIAKVDTDNGWMDRAPTTYKVCELKEQEENG